MTKLSGRTTWLAALGAFALLVSESEPAASVRKQDRSDVEVSRDLDAVDIQMRNVNFRLAKDIVLEVRALRGRLRRTNPAIPVSFDDATSFAVDIDSAEVAISAASLTSLMNSYVLAYPGAPIKKVEVTFRGDRIIQKGTIHKGVDLPFEMEGSVSATNDGNIRLHSTKIKAAHVPVKGLLHLFGKDLANVVNQNAGRGMRIADNDIVLNLRALTPPPHLDGRVTRVGIVDGKIVQVFDSGRHLPVLHPPFESAAYIYDRGGTLRFGKLLMNDADLEIVGDKPKVFDFFQREYLKQLVPGYSKTTPSNGLVAHMLDYSHFSTPARL